MKLPCLIAGAGPSGLTLALLLARYGIPTRIIERSATPSTHPQAHFINNRSMEVFRHMDGLSEEVQALSPPLDEWRHFIYCRSIANKDSAIGQVDHFPQQKNADNPSLSPEPVVHLPQNQLLPLLHRRIQKYRKEGLITIFMDHTITKVQESQEGVVVSVRGPGDKKEEIEMQGPYLAAADGANSSIRRQLGIEMAGDGPLQHLMNIHFTSFTLGRLAASWPAMIYFVFNDKVVAALVAHSMSKGEFVAQVPFFPPLQSPDDFDTKKCHNLIQAASGLGPSLRDISIKQVRPWIMDSKVAARFSSDTSRIFLLGDAAHRFPPAGGFGMNSGIQDSHNLAWKLAQSYMSGSHHQSLDLLKTYEQERRPIAIANAELSVRNWHEAIRVPQALGLDPTMARSLADMASQSPLPASASRALLEGAFGVGRWLSSTSLPIVEGTRQETLRRIFGSKQTLRLQFPREDLGFSYGPQENTSAGHDEFHPLSTPGHRMPHCWLVETAGKQVSTIDLPAGSPHPVLIVYPCSRWVDAALKVASRLKGKLHVSWIKVHSEDKPTQSQFPTSVRVFSEAFEGSFRQTMLRDGSNASEEGTVMIFLLRPDGHVAWRWIGLDSAAVSPFEREDIIQSSLSSIPI